MLNLDGAIMAIIRDEDEPEKTEEEIRAIAREFHLTPEETETLVLISQDGIGY